MILQCVYKYNFNNIAWNDRTNPNNLLDPVFLLLFHATPENLDGVLIKNAAGLTVCVNEACKDRRDRTEHNYFSAQDLNGYCPVMEAELLFEGDCEPYRVGFPLALLEDQSEEHEFAILFDGVHFQILADGIVMDRDFPMGIPCHIYAEHISCSITSEAIHDWMWTNDLSGIQRDEVIYHQKGNGQFYTPYGFNTWVGDVALYYWQERFHVFYLYDRRHHRSKRGKGAHEFWHMSSSDLRDWIDHGPVFELDEQWQTVGTGNAFEFDGKLHLSFGLHTERVKPFNLTAIVLFYQNLIKLGHTGEFGYGELGGLTPAGASYAFSEDGVHFTPSRRLMHYLENPSIFSEEDGSLLLYQEGLWKSNHLGHWTRIDSTFPPHGKDSFARNCLDCPTRFKLGGWEYFMVGFTGFWGRPDVPDAEWIDFTEKGWDTYDGVNVPMAAVFRDSRIIEGSWGGNNGNWGSYLIFREFVALGNGRIGKKWVEETLPELEIIGTFDSMSPINIPASDNILLELEFPAFTSTQVFSMVFEGEGVPCEFKLDFSTGRAQWASICDNQIPSQDIPTFREQVMAFPQRSSFWEFSHIPRLGGDFSLENLPDLTVGFKLRIMIHSTPKLGTVILDAEIAGVRTMLTNRNNLKVSKLRIFSTAIP